ncbi:unnamed protein product [Ixodes pacificus]
MLVVDFPPHGSTYQGIGCHKLPGHALMCTIFSTKLPGFCHVNLKNCAKLTMTTFNQHVRDISALVKCATSRKFQYATDKVLVRKAIVLEEQISICGSRRNWNPAII